MVNIAGDMYKYADPFGYKYTGESGGGFKTRDDKFIASDQFLTYSQNAAADIASMLGKDPSQLTPEEMRAYIEPIVSGAKTSEQIHSEYEGGVASTREAEDTKAKEAAAWDELEKTYADVESGLQGKLSEQVAEQRTALEEAWARQGGLTSGGLTSNQERLAEDALDRSTDISTKLAMERAKLKMDDIRTKDARDWEAGQDKVKFERDLDVAAASARAELAEAEASSPGFFDYLVRALPGVGSVLSALFPATK